MDGLTGAIQDRMKAEYQSKSGHMMLYMNLWSVGYLAFGNVSNSISVKATKTLLPCLALIVTGELFDFLGFIQRHPSVLWDLMTFSVASALGQVIIQVTLVMQAFLN